MELIMPTIPSIYETVQEINALNIEVQITPKHIILRIPKDIDPGKVKQAKKLADDLTLYIYQSTVKVIRKRKGTNELL
jgi:hypothetical protein